MTQPRSGEDGRQQRTYEGIKIKPKPTSFGPDGIDLN
jgi:hypothetical protein